MLKRKKAKTNSNTLRITWNNKENMCFWLTNVFCKRKHLGSHITVFPETLNFVVWWLRSTAFLYHFGRCSFLFPHFLLKYHCDNFCTPNWLTFLLTFYSISLFFTMFFDLIFFMKVEVVRSGWRGVDLFFESKSPKLEGGQQKHVKPITYHFQCSPLFPIRGSSIALYSRLKGPIQPYIHLQRAPFSLT